MKILNLLAAGNIGGIERLCEDISEKSVNDNYYIFLFGEGEIYERMCKKNKEKVISLKSLNGKILTIVKYINKFILENKIDVVVVHHGGIKCNIIYSLLKRNNVTKYVRYIHGCYDNNTWGRGENFFKDILVHRIMSISLKKSDMIICISKASKKTFTNQFKIPEEKFKIVYNGINDNFYNSYCKKYSNNDIIKFVYVGRLEYVKGLDDFINVLAELKDKINFNFSIIGDGNYRSSLEKKVSDNGLKDRIKFYGRRNNVIDYLNENDVFIYPSKWEEGFGISVVEGMARGCIPLVSNKGGLPEVVNYNESVIFSTKEELKKIILSLYKLTSEEKQNLSKKFINESKKYKIENTTNNLDLLYNDLASKK